MCDQVSSSLPYRKARYPLVTTFDRSVCTNGLCRLSRRLYSCFILTLVSFSMSFRKRLSSPSSTLNRRSLPPHVRHVSPNSPPVTSSGLSDLDTLLCGGLPLGSLTIFQEDSPTSYFVPFLNYVTAQAIHNKHSLILVSFQTPADQLLKSLPAPAKTNAKVIPRPRDVPDMSIAWRYQKLASQRQDVSFPATATPFDLSSEMEVSNLQAVSCLGRGISKDIQQLEQQILAHLQRAATDGKMTRLVVHGVSAALVDDVETFLGKVRGIMRMYGAVGVVSCTNDVKDRVCLVSGDAVLRVDSFGGRGAGAAGLGKEWLGAIVVRKGFGEGHVSGKGRGDVWVFKRSRRRFVMERATAAPDEEEGGDLVEEASLLCGNGTKPGNPDMEF